MKANGRQLRLKGKIRYKDWSTVNLAHHEIVWRKPDKISMKTPSAPKKWSTQFFSRSTEKKTLAQFSAILQMYTWNLQMYTRLE